MKLSLRKTMLSLMMAIIAVTAFGAVGVPVLPALAVGLGASFVPMPGGVLKAGIQKEIWIDDIVGNLFRTNPHLAYAMNADSFVLAGKVVHIPNAGSKPRVVRNRKSYPATVVHRNDTDITFALDEFTSDPIKISNAEKYEESPQKRQSVIGEQSNSLSEEVGDWFFYYWAQNMGIDNIHFTTGGATSAHTEGATGNRKAVTVKDVKAMQKHMNKMGIPAAGRVAHLDADMYDQFTDSLSITQERDFSKYLDAEKGIVGRLFGFTFLEPRHSILSLNSSGVVKEPDAKGATGDLAASLFWQQDQVLRALGNNEFFETENDATHYGDIYSALVRAGGRAKRADSKGVLILAGDAS